MELWMTKPDGKGRQAQSMDKERRNGAGSGAGNPVTREVERKVAQSLKKDCKPLGILYEALLNAEDSIDNVAAATDPGKDHGGMRASEARDRLHKGDHILAHHGIYDGDGHVYQYDCFLPDLLPKVMVVSLECFAAGDPVQVFDEGTFYSPDEIIGRARSRLGETRYGLVCNNCENFATWCRLGGAVEEKPEEADTLIPINP